MDRQQDGNEASHGLFISDETRKRLAKLSQDAYTAAELLLPEKWKQYSVHTNATGVTSRNRERKANMEYKMRLLSKSLLVLANFISPGNIDDFIRASLSEARAKDARKGRQDRRHSL